MTRQSADEIRAHLLEAGVPKPVVDYAVKDDISRWKGAGRSLLIFPLTIAAILIVIFIQSRVLNNYHKYFVSQRVITVDAFLYDSLFGFSAIILILWAISASAAFVGLLVTRSPSARLNAFVFTISDGKRNILSRWMGRRIAQRLEGETDPDRYILRSAQILFRYFSIVTIILTIAYAIALPIDFTSYSLFTKVAHIRSTFLPWESRGPHEWTSATSVDTACFGDSDKLARIVYNVTFADGVKVDLGQSTAVGMPWLDAMEAIDRKIANSGAKFGVWTWWIGDSYDPSCIRAMQQRFSPADFARAMRLIRYGG